MGLTNTRLETVQSIQRTANFGTSLPTTVIQASTTSSNIQLPTPNGRTAATDLLVYNTGSVAVHVWLGTDNTVAAGVPVVGTPAYGIPVGPQQSCILDLQNFTWVAAITSGSTANVELCVGTGN